MNYRKAGAGALALGATVLVVSLVGFTLANCWGRQNIVSPGQGPGYVLKASGYLAERAADVRDVAVDSSGNIYLAGEVNSPDFPATEGALDTSLGTGGSSAGQFGPSDAFIMKLDQEGRLVWATYLGGPNTDRVYGMEVDALGHVYVAGRAGEGFPTTPGAAQTEFAGDTNDPAKGYGRQDGFVSKLSPDGGGLVWSTYFGGPGKGFIRDIDIDAEGNVYIGASTMSGPLRHITPDAAQRELRGKADAVYAKLSADGTTILYATYYGGSDGDGNDGVNPSVRVSASGEVYFLASTETDDIPITEGAFQPRRAGKMDMMLAKFSAEGALLFSTYLGGREIEEVETHGLALDAQGNPVAAGLTSSPDFPMTAEAFQPELAGPGDGFIAKLSSDGTRLLAATYLGGGGSDMIEGVAVAPGGEVVVSGTASSDDFPVTGNALRTRSKGGQDAIVTKFGANLSHALYSTYIGGSARDWGRSIALAESGEIVSGGFTDSEDFPMEKSLASGPNLDWPPSYAILMPKPD